MVPKEVPSYEYSQLVIAEPEESEKLIVPTPAPVHVIEPPGVPTGAAAFATGTL